MMKVLPVPLAEHELMPVPPCARNEVGSGGEGGRGANLEDVVVADRGQHVVVVL